MARDMPPTLGMNPGGARSVSRRGTIGGRLMVYPWWRLVIGLGVLALVAVGAASQGSVDLPPITVAEIVASRLPLVDFNPSWPEAWDTILWKLRLPRIALAVLVGAALAISGATYQGLFRNSAGRPVSHRGGFGGGTGSYRSAADRGAIVFPRR